MSFGASPSDIIKLVEFSTRIYVAFKDANDNSETQVKALIEEFSEFHTCLLELDELMKEYGKRLPFSVAGFKETLERCQKALEPYSTHLVDNKKMTVKKAYYTVKYIGQEKEIDNLRKQISGHYSALQLRINFLQIRLHLEATKQTQRLLASVPFRSISVDGHMYTTNGMANSSRASLNALPAPSEASQVYREWLLYDQWLKAQNERVAAEDGTLVRPISLGGTPAGAPLGDDRAAAALYHLQKEVEDVMLIEENRAKRRVGEQRNNLSPSDAVRREIQSMRQVPPQRTLSVGTYASDLSNEDMSSSVATVRPTSISFPSAMPSGGPQILNDALPFQPIEWGPNLSPPLDHSDSISTYSTSRTSFSTSPRSPSDASSLGISTAATSPDDLALRHAPSAASLASLVLGESVLSWKELAKRVQVQRTSSRGKKPETCSCDIHWRYREDTGLSFRAVSRCDKHVWTVQHFPASGPFIPLTTTDLTDGEISLDFPRSSFGKLEKGCTDIKYTFASLAASVAFQTMLYSNNGQDRATLLFDRQIKEISSDKNRPECRARNIRLWQKLETCDEPGGSGQTECVVLLLLFYTSALEEKKAHWVEEPHHVFQWLKESEYKESSDRLKLVFSKEPAKWTGEKLFRTKKDSKDDSHMQDMEDVSLGMRGSVFLRRTNTVTSISSASAMSVASSKSGIFRRGRGANGAANLNRFGYSELEIKFQSKQDRKDFVAIWKEHVRPLGHVDRN